MEPELDYFLLCENAIVDDRGRVSIINVYDRIYTTKLPAMHQPLTFASRVNFKKKPKEDSSFSIGLSIKTPKAVEKIQKMDLGKGKLESDKKSTSINIKIPGVVFDEFGEYKVTFKIDGKIIAKRSFSVIKAENEDINDSNKR